MYKGEVLRKQVSTQASTRAILFGKMVQLRYAATTKETGWLTRETVVAGGLIRRVDTSSKRLFFKLRSSSLSAHPAESYPELWRSPVKEVREIDMQYLRLTLKLERSVVTLRAHSREDFRRWHDAFMASAGASFERFYKREKFLGKGHFSAVYVASDRTTSDKFAVKIIKKDKNDLEKSKKFIRREVKVLSVTNHPNLVRAVDFFSSAGKPHIVMEYVAGGSLRELIKRKTTLSEHEARAILRGLLQGVAYLHKSNIVHRDLKPENVLMERDDFPKITDFGLATFLNGDDKHIHSVVGTPSYVAPEIMRNVPYGPPADVWALGIILYFMIVGERPYVGETRDEIKRSVLAGELRFPMDTLGPTKMHLRHLISQMLSHDQRTRITAADALQHPWLAMY